MIGSGASRTSLSSKPERTQRIVAQLGRPAPVDNNLEEAGVKKLALPDGGGKRRHTGFRVDDEVLCGLPELGNPLAS